MTLMQSLLGFIASIAVIVICRLHDKKTGVDNLRVVVCIAGVMALMCFFFLLLNTLIVSGAFN